MIFLADSASGSTSSTPCHSLFPRWRWYAPPKAELKSRFALVDVRAAGHRMSAAKLQLRVGGYRKPRFWSFDDAAKYAPSPPNEHALPLALSPI